MEDLSETKDPDSAAADDGGNGQVQRLTPGMTGRWLVFTQRSVHVWDLHRFTYARRPGEGSQSFAWDAVEALIWEVRAWPEVGGTFLVYFEDPADPSQVQWRMSSRIRRIEPDE